MLQSGSKFCRQVKFSKIIREVRQYTDWPHMKDEHVALSKLCKDFADAELRPHAAKHDQERLFPTEQIKKLGELGMMGINVSPKYGGAGMDTLSYVIALEEVARGDASCAVILTGHNSLFCNPMEQFGTESQKEQFLVPCASGQEVSCFMLTEPGNGSDAGAASTTAILDKDGQYLLNGTKAWISHSHQAKYGIVMATTDKSLKHKGISAFIVDLKTSSVRLGKNEMKMGIRGDTTSTVTFTDHVVSRDCMLGEPGRGFPIAMATLDGGRIGVAAQACGIAQASMDCAVKYSKERLSFGQPISSLYAIQQKLAQMSVKIDAARLLTHKAAMMKDAGKNFTKDAAQAKLFASEAATFCAHQAIQVLGGIGYVSDMPAERHYRDARITEIYDGTSEIQHIVIARAVQKEYE